MSELKQVQDKLGHGYLSAFPEEHFDRLQNLKVCLHASRCINLQCDRIMPDPIERYQARWRILCPCTSLSFVQKQASLLKCCPIPLSESQCPTSRPKALQEQGWTHCNDIVGAVVAPKSLFVISHARPPVSGFKMCCVYNNSKAAFAKTASMSSQVGSVITALGDHHP